MTENVSEVVGAVRRLGIAADAYGPTLNTGSSPRDVEIVGQALAVGLAEQQPDLVAVWTSSDEAVLGHVVARELGTSVLHAAEVEGVLFFQPEPEPGRRVALLATVWQPARRLDRLHALAKGRDLGVVAAGAVLDSEPPAALRGVPMIWLVPANEVVVEDER